MIWAVCGLLLVLAVLVSVAQGKLHEWSNRSRTSGVDTRPEAISARLHTEQERWEDTFDLRNPETVAQTNMQIQADQLLLDRTELRFYAGMDKLWDEVRRVCQLDKIDEAWVNLGAELAADLVAA